MKVALIDNTNNNFFAFARYLHDLGVDAYLFTTPHSKFKHYLPEADTFTDVKNIKWIRYFPVPINNLNWIFLRKKKIKKELDKFDLIITCGLSSAFLERIGIRSDIIIPFGEDLYKYPFHKVNFSLTLDSIRSLFWNSQAKYQRKAYQHARFFITDGDYILSRKAIKSLNLTVSNIGLPMLYNKENLINKENIDLWNFLDSHDFILFNHSRQIWKTPNKHLDDCMNFGGAKRNDKLIRAFSQYIKNSKYKKPLLVLFNYGIDVVYSVQLIKDLKIEQYVKWMPLMNRINIMYGLSKATFSANAFREKKIDIGGVCYESLSVGTPHINNCVEALTNKKHKFYNCPMIHALDEDEIVSIFADYEDNPDKYKRIGKESVEWFDQNLGSQLAKRFKNILLLLNKNRELTHLDKPVKDLVTYAD